MREGFIVDASNLSIDNLLSYTKQENPDDKHFNIQKIEKIENMPVKDFHILFYFLSFIF